MTDIFESMLSAYPTSTPQERRNATYEVMQEVVLCGLQRGGFFKEEAFCGGSRLSMFRRL